MDGENQVIHIPIYEYEEDLNTELSRDKKKEIIELLTNHNHFCSLQELNEIKDKLHQACRKGDIDLIKIYLSATIQSESKDLTFKIDKTNKTASLFTINDKKGDCINIPRSIQHESEEYLITSICWIGNDFYNLPTIIFDENSAVTTIYPSSFSDSDIIEIYFPKSLKELKEGWCNGANRLEKIIIPPLNDQFVFKENKYLLGKSDNNNDEFDILHFVNRNVDKFSIPTNIKIISSYSFSSSYIEEIIIPQNVIKIGEYSFYFCRHLNKIGIPTNSNLKIIECGAFSNTKIEELYLPENFVELKEGWCSATIRLKRIIVSPSNNRFIFKENKYLLGKSDNNNDDFDILHFVNRDVKNISIPINIKIIASFSLAELKIEEVCIPQNVSKICAGAFYCCSKLKKVEIPTNSNLQIIEKNAFFFTKIEEFSVPPTVSRIGDYAFYFCSNLKIVEFAEKSKLQSLSPLIFDRCPNVTIMIPPSSNGIIKYI